MMQSFVIVYKHAGFTTQLPPAPVYTFPNKYSHLKKILVTLLKFLW